MGGRQSSYLLKSGKERGRAGHLAAQPAPGGQGYLAGLQLQEGTGWIIGSGGKIRQCAAALDVPVADGQAGDR